MPLLDDAIAMQTMQYPGGPVPRSTLDIPPGSGGYSLARAANGPVAGPPAPEPSQWLDILYHLMPWLAAVGAMKYAYSKDALTGRPLSEVAKQIGIPEVTIRPGQQPQYVGPAAPPPAPVPQGRTQYLYGRTTGELEPMGGGGGMGGRLFSPYED